MTHLKDKHITNPRKKRKIKKKRRKRNKKNIEIGLLKDQNIENGKEVARRYKEENLQKSQQSPELMKKINNNHKKHMLVAEGARK